MYGDASTNDVAVSLKLNGTEICRDYHSKKEGHDIWPGLDPAIYSSYYNDTGANVFTIENIDPNKSIKFYSFDIYRVYQFTAIP